MATQITRYCRVADGEILKCASQIRGLGKPPLHDRLWILPIFFFFSILTTSLPTFILCRRHETWFLVTVARESCMKGRSLSCVGGTRVAVQGAACCVMLELIISQSTELLRRLDRFCSKEITSACRSKNRPDGEIWVRWVSDFSTLWNILYFHARCVFPCKVKVKCTLLQALNLCTGRTAHRVSRGITLLFLVHGTRRGWGVSVTPRPLFTPGKDPVPIVQEAVWAPGPVWTGRKSRPHRDSIPDTPPRGKSLYRLSYWVHLSPLGTQLFKFYTDTISDFRDQEFDLLKFCWCAT